MMRKCLYEIACNVIVVERTTGVNMDSTEIYEAAVERFIEEFYDEFDREPTDEEIDANEHEFTLSYLDDLRGCY